jgi:hypothetical protein
LQKRHAALPSRQRQQPGAFATETATETAAFTSVPTEDVYGCGGVQIKILVVFKEILVNFGAMAVLAFPSFVHLLHNNKHM